MFRTTSGLPLNTTSMFCSNCRITLRIDSNVNSLSGVSARFSPARAIPGLFGSLKTSMELPIWIVSRCLICTCTIGAEFTNVPFALPRSSMKTPSAVELITA